MRSCAQSRNRVSADTSAARVCERGSARERLRATPRTRERIMRRSASVVSGRASSRVSRAQTGAHYAPRRRARSRRTRERIMRSSSERAPSAFVRACARERVATRCASRSAHTRFVGIKDRARSDRARARNRIARSASATRGKGSRGRGHVARTRAPCACPTPFAQERERPRESVDRARADTRSALFRACVRALQARKHGSRAISCFGRSRESGHAKVWIAGDPLFRAIGQELQRESMDRARSTCSRARTRSVRESVDRRRSPGSRTEREPARESMDRARSPCSRAERERAHGITIARCSYQASAPRTGIAPARFRVAHSVLRLSPAIFARRSARTLSPAEASRNGCALELTVSP